MLHDEHDEDDLQHIKSPIKRYGSTRKIYLFNSEYLKLMQFIKLTTGPGRLDGRHRRKIYSFISRCYCRRDRKVKLAALYLPTLTHSMCIRSSHACKSQRMSMINTQSKEGENEMWKMENLWVIKWKVWKTHTKDMRKDEINWNTRATAKIDQNVYIYTKKSRSKHKLNASLDLSQNIADRWKFIGIIVLLTRRRWCAINHREPRVKRWGWCYVLYK